MLFWSERRESNPRPSPWQGDILPLNYSRERSEREKGEAFTLARTLPLYQHKPWWARQDLNLHRFYPTTSLALRVCQFRHSPIMIKQRHYTRKL